MVKIKLPVFSIDSFGYVSARFPHKPQSARQALQWSIAKWEYIVDRLTLSTGIIKSCGNADTCSLCTLFLKENSVDCRNCPVKAVTGYDQCGDTAYHKFKDKPTKEHAVEEFNFLKALLHTVE